MRTKRSFALVIVLVLLALATILVVGLLVVVGNDRKTSKIESNGSGSHLLADEVVQEVIGQIQQATAGGPTTAWASQPGMIRTYDNTGAELTNYKLYSSGAMTTTGSLTVGGTAGIGANKVNDFDPNWASKTAIWTDLNLPVTDASGYIDFPILDGNNIKLLTKDANGNAASSYYGFDAYNNTTGAAGADGLPDVQGFSIDPNQVTYNPAQTLSPSNTPVPMPVQWLYQLRDGTVIAGDSTSTTTATFVNAAKQPSASNPIVARIAFWTDDETSKVNINTAGEGTYWDTPRFYGKDNNPAGLTSPTGVVNSLLMTTNNLEMQYAFNQPAQFEFQRYPGHPAQVALSPILPKLAALSVATGVAVTDAQNVANTMANVTPFLASGATAGGTIGGTVRAGGAINLSLANRTAPYASIDELQFATSGTTPRTVTTDVNGNALVGKADLERARFFVTASSRAPEVNLFGLPRISDWPIHTSLATNSTSLYTTSFDRLTAYCSTIGSTFYHFQRQKFNDTGFDYSSITRNQQLYTYLQNLTSQPVPGFGGGSTGFLSKFGADRDQILTEIFDYIRCTDDFDVNLGPPPGDTMTPTKLYGATQYQFAQYQGYPVNASYGQITPIKIGTTKGLGRFPTLTEVAVVFICCADGTQPASSTTTLTQRQLAQLTSNMSAPTNYPPVTLSNPNWTNQINSFITNNSPFTDVTLYSNPAFNYPPNSTRNLGPTQKMYQMALLFKTFCPSSGLYPIQPDFILQVSGNGTTYDQAITINGATPANPFMAAPANFPTFNCLKLGNYQLDFGGNSGFQGTWGPCYLCWAHDPPLGFQKQNYPIYAFISKPFIIDTSVTSALQFASDVQLQINLYHGLYSYDGNQSSANFSVDPLSSSITGQKVNATPTPAPTVQTVVNNPANLIQTFNVTLPARNPVTGSAYTFPFPTLACTPGTEVTATNNVTCQWYIPYRGSNTKRYLIYGDQGTNSLAWTDVCQSVSVYNGDGRQVAATPVVDSFSSPSVFLPHPRYGDGATPFADYLRAFQGSASQATAEQFPMDTTGTTTTKQGRLVNLPYGKVFNEPASPDAPHYLLTSNPSASTQILADPTLANGPAYTMDWDNAIAGEVQDGAYINKADDGDFQNGLSGGFNLPYFNYGDNSVTNAATFLTPNRLMPSPGMFGSLPTGAQRGKGWQTLLFRPATQANGKQHPDAGVPAYSASYNQYTTAPDHLLMDLFWTPVVEPYAISDPFSTAGKINMNYQIAPFTYLDRSTPLVCLMKSEKLIAVPSADSQIYKNYGNTHQYRLPLDMSETGSLRQFKARFAAGDLFRSATVICDIFLKPIKDALGARQTWSADSDAVTFWSNNLMTGDNMREKPYTNLYGRLTTKSNTFTVHFRAQTLQKAPNTPANQWVDGSDVVTSDYRGSTLIERYLDVSDPNVTGTDWANAASTANLDTLYKFRVVSTKRFAP